MVAYSFKKRFGEDIVALRKRQTIRANRKRHARPGERIQLYTAMRTKKCRKLLAVDPVCTDVEPVKLMIGETCIQGIHLDGTRLSSHESEVFARADGFADLQDMHAFWLAEHGVGDFQGVVIRWSPVAP